MTGWMIDCEIGSQDKKNITVSCPLILKYGANCLHVVGVRGSVWMVLGVMTFLS
jgi:hypothetical protein